jgi:hypothetical protein
MFRQVVGNFACGKSSAAMQGGVREKSQVPNDGTVGDATTLIGYLIMPNTACFQIFLDMRARRAVIGGESDRVV